MIKMCDQKRKRLPTDWLSASRCHTVWRRPRQLWIACTHPAMDVVLKRVCEQLPALILRQPQFTVPASESGDALVKWALDELGVQELVVCGHSCGWRHSPQHDSDRDRGDLRERMRNRELCGIAARDHLVRQLDYLKSRPQLMDAIEREELMVQGLFYLTESGVFTLYNDRTREFEAL